VLGLVPYVVVAYPSVQVATQAEASEFKMVVLPEQALHY
jgi:hypothetical protein